MTNTIYATSQNKEGKNEILASDLVSMLLTFLSSLDGPWPAHVHVGRRKGEEEQIVSAPVRRLCDDLCPENGQR